MHKTCNKCGVSKSLGQYPTLWSGYGDGHTGTCKECSRKWKKENYLLKRERRIETAVEWAKKNRDRVNTNARRWKAKNPEKVRVWNREYDRRNPRKRADTKKKYLDTIKLTDDGTITLKSLDALCIAQDYKCNICKTDISGRREKDHIIPVSKGGPHTISNIQWVCPRCNKTKANKIL